VVDDNSNNDNADDTLEPEPPTSNLAMAPTRDHLYPQPKQPVHLVTSVSPTANGLLVAPHSTVSFAETGVHEPLNHRPEPHRPLAAFEVSTVGRPRRESFILAVVSARKPLQTHPYRIV